MQQFESLDFLSIFYIIIILFIGWLIKNKHQKEFPEYKYFLTGLNLKLLGVISFIFVYGFYYGGGDTFNYFKGSSAIVGLLLENPGYGLQELLGFGFGGKYYGWFNENTGYPPLYMWRDSHTFSVCRYSVPFVILGARTFFTSSILVATFSYIGLWKLYRLFNILYPGYSRGLARLILFLPSLLFWGSGIMKDSFMICATCWITYNFYMVFIARKKVISNTLILIFNFFLIINVKSYIILSLIPGMVLWLYSLNINKIKNSIIRRLMIPFIFLGFLSAGSYFIGSVSELMGVYGDMDSAIEQAQVIQEDLLRANQYGKNSYNIGEIENSLVGLITIAPIAVFTALFRPLFWEVGSVTMVISALENSMFLLFCIYFLINSNPFIFFKTIKSNPFLIYCLTFALIFAFGVGIAGTNFGALVRYKIPLIPFFFSSIFLVSKLIKKQ
tara:strand:- start:8924 stop:10252 length:1329 start_codon:yes stop_codon:yes gene_type:complete